MTQKQLAEELTQIDWKTSNTAIANWESGLNSPNVDTVQLMSQIFEKDGNYFFNTEGLDEKYIDEIHRCVEFIRNKKKNEGK